MSKVKQNILADCKKMAKKSINEHLIRNLIRLLLYSCPIWIVIAIEQMTPKGYLSLLPGIIPTKDKPKENEDTKIDIAKIYVFNFNRSQKGYFQINHAFANSLTELAGGMGNVTEDHRYFTTNEPKILTKDLAIYSSKSYSQRQKPFSPDYLSFSWVAIPLSQDLTSNSELSVQFYTILCKSSGSDFIPSASDRIEFTPDYKNAKCPERMEQVNPNGS
jgi:hypothetical protein